MGRRGVQYVVLCEDRQHEVFARRFLKRIGLVANNHQLRITSSPVARGAADKFVCDTYPKELQAVRRTSVSRALLVVIDGDEDGVNGRMRQLEAACEANGVESRSSEDRVAIFVPTWNIETWIAYLDGQDVDERRRDYPRLARPRECRIHVAVLTEMCKVGRLRHPAPDSLQAACDEYDTTLRPTG